MNISTIKLYPYHKITSLCRLSKPTRCLILSYSNYSKVSLSFEIKDSCKINTVCLLNVKARYRCMGSFQQKQIYPYQKVSLIQQAFWTNTSVLCILHSFKSYFCITNNRDAARVVPGRYIFFRTWVAQNQLIVKKSFIFALFPWIKWFLKFRPTHVRKK